MVATVDRVRIEQELLSLPDAARELELSHVQIWRLVKADKIPVVRVGQPGRKVVFGVRREALDEYRRERRKPGRPRGSTTRSE